MRETFTTDTEQNMCDTCLNDFADCESQHVTFGNGVGNDNVISCDFYNGKDTPCMQVGKLSGANWDDRERKDRLKQHTAALAAKMSELATQFVDDLSFDVLIGWADVLGVEHDEKQWLDDMWPEKESELRVEVAEAMERIGKKK